MTSYFFRVGNEVRQRTFAHRVWAEIAAQKLANDRRCVVFLSDNETESGLGFQPRRPRNHRCARCKKVRKMWLCANAWSSTRTATQKVAGEGLVCWVCTIRETYPSWRPGLARNGGVAVLNP